MSARKSRPITPERVPAQTGPPESQQLFYQVFDASPAAILLTRLADGILVGANPSFLRLTGYALDEVVGRTTTQIGILADQQAREQRLAALTQGKPVPDFEVEITTKSGEVRSGLATVATIALGEEQFALSTFIDITGRKQAEEKLLSSEARYRRLFEAAKDGILILEADTGEIVDVNPFLMEMLGYSHAEFLGKQLWEISLFKDEAANKAAFLQLQEDGYIRYENLPLETKDGRLIWVEFVSNVYPVGDSQVIQCNIRDITARKQAEEKLGETEANLRAVQQALAEGVIFLDMHGTVVSKNDAVESVLGRSLQELADHGLNPRWRMIRSDKSLYPLDEQPAMLALRTGEPVRNVEMGVALHDGTIKWALVNAQLVRDTAGTTLGVVVSFFDITKRKRAEQKIRSQLEQLNSLREIDTAILSSFDMNLSLEVIVSKTISELKVDAADILLLNSGSALLDYRAGWGFHTNIIQNYMPQVGESIAGRCVQERKPVYIRDLREHADELAHPALLTEEKFIGYCCIPLIDKMEVKGVMEIFQRSPLDPDQEWIDFLHTLARQAAIAIESATLFDDLQRSNLELSLAYTQTIEGWSRALDLRDKETEGHTQRVTEMTTELAQAFGFSPDELVHIRRGALLHDIGKMGVPDEILFKPGPLTDDEWAKMRMHPQFAHDLISPIQYLKPALDIPYCHHEKWDGTGYPRGLREEQIPLAARLFAVVDVWDALSYDRPYRDGWTREQVMEHIRSLAGTHFDPQCVEPFFKLVNRRL